MRELARGVEDGLGVPRRLGWRSGDKWVENCGDVGQVVREAASGGRAALAVPRVVGGGGEVAGRGVNPLVNPLYGKPGAPAFSFWTSCHSVVLGVHERVREVVSGSKEATRATLPGRRESHRLKLQSPSDTCHLAPDLPCDLRMW